MEDTSDNNQDLAQSTSQTNPDSERTTKAKKTKRIIAIIVSIIVLTAAVIAAWLALDKRKSDPPVSGEPVSSASQNGYISQDTSAKTEPYALIYAQRPNETQPYQVYWKTLDGTTSPVAALTLSADDYPLEFAVSGRYVALNVQGKETASIWLSSDSGASFQKAYTSKTDGQITSLIFSHDQKRLLAAVLDANSTNTVKEIIVTSLETSDLFSSEHNGVFLHDYDSSKSVLYYSSGCYNCDGNTFMPLFRRDLSTDSQSEILNTTGRYLLKIGIKRDGSELIYALGSAVVEGIGDGPPYDLHTQTTETGQDTKLLTNDLERFAATGYSTSNQPYYALGSKVYRLPDNKVLFDAEKTIQSLPYVSDELIVAVSGDYPTLQVVSYRPETTTAATQLTENQHTLFGGVVEK